MNDPGILDDPMDIESTQRDPGIMPPPPHTPLLARPSNGLLNHLISVRRVALQQDALEEAGRSLGEADGAG